MGTAPSLDGRTFAGVSNVPAGDVGSDNRFEYHEEWEWDSQPGSGTSLVREIDDCAVVGA